MADLQQLAVNINNSFNDRSFRTNTKDFVVADVEGRDLPTGQVLHGVDGFVQYNESFVKAMPDIKGSIVSQSANGHKVTTRVRGQGTFTGEMVLPQGTVPGNGKKLDLEYSAEFEFNESGMLVKYTFNYDMAEFMRQLGLG